MPAVFRRFGVAGIIIIILHSSEIHCRCIVLIVESAACLVNFYEDKGPIEVNESAYLTINTHTPAVALLAWGTWGVGWQNGLV